MKCKTSFFNGTISKNLLRRYWPAVLGGLALWLLILLNILSGSLERMQYGGWDGADEVFYETANIGIVLFCPAAFLGAMLCMSHIHNRTAAQFYLGLPVKRRCVYYTAVITCYLSLLIPYLVAVGAGSVMGIAYGVTYRGVLAMAGVGLASLTIYFGMAVVCNVLAGQTVGAVLLYIGSHGFLALMERGVNWVARHYIPGINGLSRFGIISLLTPTTGMSDMAWVMVDESAPVFRNALGLAIYGLCGVALLLFGAALYQRRKAENAGQMLAFWWLKTPCKIFGACSITVAAVTIFWMFNDPSWDAFGMVLLCAAVVSAISWFAAEMIVGKTLRVFRKRNLLWGGGYILAILLVLVGARVDVLGIGTYVPKADNLAPQASYQTNYRNSVLIPTEDALRLHQAIVDNLDLLEGIDDGEAVEIVNLTYTRTNGTAIDRTFTISRKVLMSDDNEIGEAVQFINAKNSVAFRQVFGENWTTSLTEENFVSGVVSIYGDTSTEIAGLDDVWLNAEQAVAIYEAIEKDIAQGRIRFRDYANEDALGEICLTKASEGPETEPSVTAGLEVLAQMRNTINVLKDLKILP